MKKYNLKKIMSDAHILYNYLKKQGYSFGECLKRIWNSAKNGSSLTYLTCYKPGKSSVSCPLKPSDSTPLKHSTMPP